MPIRETRAEWSARTVRTYLAAIVGAIAVAILARTWVIEAYRITSRSMSPNLLAGDLVFVLKPGFGLRLPWRDAPLTDGRLPERGEVVLFTTPQDPELELIRRVVGLPGDAIEIRAGRLSVNGRALGPEGESCGPEDNSGIVYRVCRAPGAGEDFGPETIPPGEVFLLPDFRGDPRPDPAVAPPKRLWAKVDQARVRARAWVVWLSIDEQESVRWERTGSPVR